MLYTTLLLTFSLIYSLNTIVFPLERQNYNLKNEKDFYNYITRPLISKIKLGNPKQEIELTIQFKENPFFLKSYSSNGKYNENKSSTFKKTSEEFEFIRETLFTDGFLSKEKFYFKDYNNKDYTIEEFNFILATKFNSKTSKPFNACLGLTLLNKNQDMHFNFIYELKYLKKINSTIFSISYLNNKNGDLIIGNLPNEYNNNFNYKNYKTTPAESDDKSIFWNTLFDNFKINDKIVYNKSLGVFDLNFQSFRFGQSVMKSFNEIFFNQYYKDNKCIQYKNEDGNILNIVCDENINLKKFPKIYFEHKTFNYSFEFNSDELFIKIDKKLYFLILFHSYNNDFILGEIFFKKYQIVFDQDNKLIGFYGKIENNNHLFFKIAFLIFMIIIIGILLFFLYKYIILKPRKKRVNELEENFEYTPTKI